MSPTACELARRYNDNPEKLMAAYTPNLQELMTRDASLVFLGSAPQLGVVVGAFGRGVAASWLKLQLLDLSEFAGQRDKLSRRQMDETTALILAEYGSYKLTELMLFFRRFKLGRYGKFYGAVDPLVILSALAEFAGERENALRLYAEERSQAERQRQLDEAEALGKRYAQRVPPESRHLLDFQQYRLMGYDTMSDADLAADLAALADGSKTIPKDIRDIIAYLNVQ